MTNHGLELILGHKTPGHEQIKTIPNSKYLVKKTETNPKFTWKTTNKQRNIERESQNLPIHTQPRSSRNKRAEKSKENKEKFEERRVNQSRENPNQIQTLVMIKVPCRS